jgi:hypothetical protein
MIQREKFVGNVYMNFCGRNMEQLSDTGQELPFTLHIFFIFRAKWHDGRQKERNIKCGVFRERRGLNSMTYRPF